MATISALREFMPYGAPDLIDGSARRTLRAILTGVGFWLLAYVAILGWMVTHPVVIEPERTVVVPYRELGAPPPLAQAIPPPPVVMVSSSMKEPAVGMPVPVPDIQVPPQQTIASQEEIAASTGTAETSGDRVVVVQPPESGALPGLNDFVYVDELPVLVTDTPPQYPEVARQAQLEGEVLLRVLVGKDGRVVDVHVEKSIPMLDQAAVDAAKTWVFKPALCNNHPVAVWITRRIRFSLRS
jgi:periplasmic protein TonB